MPGWLAVTRGDGPLIVSIPHAGTAIPAGIAARLHDPAGALGDTDWHVDRLYRFAAGLGATVIRTRRSRVAIDVNRDPTGVSLYPGQATTGLCPVTDFAGRPLYRAGCEPGAAEIARRRALWFDPYHAALDAEIARLRARHAAVVVYDAHSIRSELPWLFDGRLPCFNIGTNGGASCDPALAAAISGLCGPDQVLNGRFKGGWITRRLGRPGDGVHAVQMELAQRAYLDEATGRIDPARMAGVQPVLRAILTQCLDFAKGQS
ncbi:N-formylglutamate deformylase [Sphingomonas changnyeongensis]|uniref:N-formylglutamate deformylase n=1 Tax=Sphingomonas changnyeongensis TaxID=2698679 RepID=A0A7Z2NY48_9SPHN|nr:N-formylglutamate deformylase [Sphingomonas changnyeongensis]QHL91547.1 N-formylglutamate deformylase [Sphingomonas changnyeongensis]